MKKYNYNENKKGTLSAEFSFIDVDGNIVTGVCSNNNLCDLLDGLGYAYLYNEMLHEVRNCVMGEFNGIVDITKPISIKISQQVTSM